MSSSIEQAKQAESKERLSAFVRGVRRTVLNLLEDDRLPAEQRFLLRAVLERFFSLADDDDWAQPLGLLYAAYRGFGRTTDAQTQLVGAFCACYLASFDSFDDVQDDDLAGKPLEMVGAPIAINSALALLLVGLRALHEGALLEPDLGRRASYLDVFNRASIVAVGAQHTDLAGLGQTPTPAQVLAMHRGKTSSVALLAECGALLGGASAAEAEIFREFGSDFAALVQIVDDVRDVYGKAQSPDLLAGKITYPVACFLTQAREEELTRFALLRTRLPSSEEDIRELLYSSGAIEAAAVAVEELRHGLHRRLVQLANPRAPHRLLLSMVDTLASALYEPEPVPESTALFAPTGGLHDTARESTGRFVRELGLAEALPMPRLVPSPAPIYLFEPKSYQIHYPDLEDLRPEIVGQFADLLGLETSEVEVAMVRSMPLLLAHEMFHAWRHVCGRLSDDAWHEEFIANRLAMGYALRHAPDAAAAVIEMSRLVLDATTPADGEDDILVRALQPGLPSDYQLSFVGAARVHAQMLLDAAQSCEFDEDRARFVVGLSPPPEDGLIAAE